MYFLHSGRQTSVLPFGAVIAGNREMVDKSDFVEIIEIQVKEVIAQFVGVCLFLPSLDELWCNDCNCSVYC